MEKQIEFLKNKISNEEIDLLLQQGLHGFGEGLFIYIDDKEGTILYSNSSLWRIFECNTEEEFLNHVHGTFNGMVYSEDLNSTLISINNQITGNNIFDYVKYRIMTKNGKIRYVDDFGHHFKSKKFGDCFFVSIRALGSEYEPLTGLPAPTYFVDKSKSIEKEIYRKKQVPAMLAFNINGLKLFNIKYGMDEGDELLIYFAKQLSDVFGHENCSRFGEDNFYVLTSSYQIRGRIDEVFERIKHFKEGVSVSCRCGLYIYEESDSINASIAVERARLASDSLGHTIESSVTRFNHHLKEELRIKDYVLNHLDEALANNQIKAYFQPQVITNTVRMYGFEALARWFAPEIEMLSPQQFIPVLEEYGLTYKLDLFIIEQACIAIRRMLDRGSLTVPVSVNLSRTDFTSIDPVNELVTIVDKYHLPHDRIRVEITESTIISDPDKIRKQIHRFRTNGFFVMMDDFGSQYSSLSTLRDFEFDEVKIDMGFMKNFSERSKNILRSMVTMAKSLGIHTLCEGVEREEQVEFLKSIGCEFVQGFYFGKPLPFNEAVALAIKITNDYYKYVSKEKEERLKHPAYTPTADDNRDYTHSVLGALASVFSTVFLFDLREDKYSEIKSNYALERFLGKEGKISANWSTIIHAFTHTDFVQAMLHFTDSTTLQERLKKKDLLVTEFLNTIHGWCRSAFFVLERDESGNAIKVLNTVRIIDKEKNDEIGMKTLLFSLSKFYFALISLNLFNHQLTPLILPDEYSSVLGHEAQPYELTKNMFIAKSVKPTFKMVISNFLDMLTIESRLKNKPFLTLDFTSMDNKWRRIIISPSYFDNTGKLVEVKIGIEDIDEARNKEFLLQYQADHDALTGLRNRGSYEKYIAQLKESTHPLAFLFLDIDRFKAVNDTYGHEVGDVVLKEFAKNIKEEFSYFGNANRLGGDEFVIIINDFIEKDAQILIDKIKKINKKMQNPVTEEIPKVSISCGIAFSTNGFSHDLVRRADITLYHIKHNGGNDCCIYDQSFVDVPEEMLKHKA